MKRTELRRKTPMPKGKPLRRIERLLPGGPTRRLKRKVAGLRAPGTPARTDRDTRRSWNSTLPASRKPMKQGRGRKCYAHLRDEPHKAHVRTLPCLLAGRPGHICRGRVEFSHVMNEGNGHPDYANGLPLCGEAGHRRGAKSWHVMGRESWQAYWGVDAVAEAVRIATAYRGAAA